MRLIAILMTSVLLIPSTFGDVLPDTTVPCDPYRVGLGTPKLTTPQWVGETGVEAVVILSIDDMRDTGKYEDFLRPILNRLKAINGRAPLSIFTNSVPTDDAMLQRWLTEGLSLEVHTIDHPCPLLRDGDFAKAKGTYDQCVDLMSAIPGNRPVAFRMPCCDSLNTPSPRFWTEIFEQQTPQKNYLAIDSSVFNIFTSDDPELPPNLIRDEQGQPRFRRYLPFKSFVNTIENYPYPYVVGRACWEFPCVVPSDWEAQNVQQPNNPDTVRDLKRALDATVIKQGVMPIVFHPHGWIRNDQLVDFIAYAAEQYGDKVRFLTFADALSRINQHLLGGAALRTDSGNEFHVRLLDVNRDGLMDVVRKSEDGLQTRVWDAARRTFRVDVLAGVHAPPTFFTKGDQLGMCTISTDWQLQLWQRRSCAWQQLPAQLETLNRLLTGNPPSASDGITDVRWRDVDRDGTSELFLTWSGQTKVFGWRGDALEELPYALPISPLVGNGQRDRGIRFRDLDQDGRDDIVMSNGETYGVWLLEDEGWRAVRVGNASDADAIPVIANRDGTNNGAWFHSDHLWVQNEFTNRLPDLVQRVSFDALLRPGRDEGAESLGTARSLEDSVASIQLVGGATLEVVAAEPQVQDPVALDWGPDGSLWVVEMGDYPNGREWHGPGDPKGTPGGRVKLLEDRDRDGRFETAHLFLKDLPSPTAVKAWRDGVLVCAPPNIIFAKDTDGDHRADVQQVLYTGLAEGNQQHRANGLRWGLDHWIHLANGDSGGRVQSAKSGSEINIRGRDFRIQPDTGQLQLTSGQSQFGRSRDNEGNWFGGNNSHPVWHYVLEEAYMRRNPHFSPPSARHEIAAVPGAAPVYPISRTVTRFNDFDRADRFTSACSPEIGRVESGESAASDYVYVCEPVHNLVHRARLREDGITFSSSRAPAEQQLEFMRSSDNWFRPVMVRTGPDSAIWVVDMYRMVIEHPEWIPMHWQEQIDHLAGEDRGRIYRIRLPGRTASTAWNEIRARSLPDLVSMLDTPNGVIRDMVQQELYERSDRTSVPLLKKQLDACRWESARLPIMYLLAHLDALDESLLSRWLAEPTALRHALRIAEPRLQRSQRLRDLLFQSVVPRELASGSRPPLLQLAYTLGEVDDDRVGSALARIALTAPDDAFLRAGVLSSVSNRNIEAVLAALQSEVDGAGNLVGKDDALLSELIKSAVGFEHEPAIRRFVQILETADGQSRQLTLLGALLKASRQHDLKLSTVLDMDAQSLLERLAELALQTSRDPMASDTDRLAALETFGYQPALRGRELDTLIALLAPQHSQRLQSTALSAIGRLGGGQQAAEVFQRWNSFSPALRATSLNAALSRTEWLDALFDGLESGEVLPVQVSVRHRQLLMRHQDPEVRRRAAAVFSPSDSDRHSVVEAYASQIVGQPDAENGRKVFKKECSACHRLENVGNQIGPDLTALSDKSMRSMLVAILDPNRAVEEKYLDYTAVTLSGEIHSGLLLDESATAITLVAANGQRIEVLRNQLSQLVATGKSVMPDGLEEVVLPDAMNDLIAYVQSVSAVRKQFDGNHPQVAPVRDDGSIRLFAMHAEIYGPNLVFEPEYRNLGFWSSSHDRAVWTIDAPAAGEYQVRVDYACPPQGSANRFLIQVNGQRLGDEVAATGGWDDYRTKSLGYVQLPDEPVELTIRSEGNISGFLFDLRTILLHPR